MTAKANTIFNHSYSYAAYKIYLEHSKIEFREPRQDKLLRTGQRRLRTETVFGTQKNSIHSVPEIPLEVLKIHQKYAGMSLNKMIDGRNFNDALILIKYHLLRPDEMGLCAKNAAEKGGPLELIKLCLPDFLYLNQNPICIDQILDAAKKSRDTKPGVIAFLLDRTAVKNCVERDSYFKEWFDYEMKMAGAKENEWFEEFAKRNGNVAELNLLISKLPAEARYAFIKGNISYNWHLNLNHFLRNDGAGFSRNYEYALIALRYSIYKPTYYKDADVRIDISARGSFEWLLSGSPSRDDRGYFVWLELWKRLIPSKEYRDAHPKTLDLLYSYWVHRIIEQSRAGENNEKVIELLKLLEREGVNMKNVPLRTPFAKEFLKNAGFLD